MFEVEWLGCHDASHAEPRTRLTLITPIHVLRPADSAMCTLCWTEADVNVWWMRSDELNLLKFVEVLYPDFALVPFFGTPGRSHGRLVRSGTLHDYSLRHLPFSFHRTTWLCFCKYNAFCNQCSVTGIQCDGPVTQWHPPACRREGCVRSSN
ncbi:hypothetical protein CC86DRAFT_51057 [Ophiobolus disseminans]|uniref:Uncharacterized protein n=1 Tax=Ophiobolus disseminans TaxID=1469910 RepID=A0A6A6ZTH3_9PLEO|nr:hypothetical protein CC86DRAFT_51057 [Ophiobolus disseminans]